MTIKVRRSGVGAAGLVLLGLLGGCGGGADSAAQPEPSPSPADPRTKAQLFLDTARERGITTDISADEVDSVAANSCDNTVQETVGFFDAMEVIGRSVTDVLVERRILFEIYCPDDVVILEEAARQATN